MPGLVPGIHVLLRLEKTWMAGTSPAMTISERTAVPMLQRLAAQELRHLADEACGLADEELLERG
jgi:hypothetical protein